MEGIYPRDEELDQQISAITAEVEHEDVIISTDNISASHDALFKVILVGDSSVGKTSLLHRMKTNEFITNTVTTVGAEHT